MNKPDRKKRSRSEKQLPTSLDNIARGEDLQNQARNQEPITWVPRVIKVKPNVYCASCSPDGQYIVTGGYGGIWQRSANNGVCAGRYTLDPECAVIGVHYSSKGQFLVTQSASLSDRCIAIKTWNSRNHKILSNYYIHKKKGVYTLIPSHDDNFIAYTDTDAQIYICSIKKCKQIRRIVGHQDYVEQIRFKNDNQYILSASWDKSVRVWNISSAKQRCIFNDQHCVRFIQFSSDEQTIMSSNTSNIISFWGVSSGLQLDGSILNIIKTIEKLYYSPDGRALFIVCDQEIIIWSLQTNGKIREIKNSSQYVFTNLHFSPNGEFMIVINMNTVSILKVQEYQSEDQTQNQIQLKVRLRSQIKRD